ncbi:MAG: 23S rRNA (adenine(2503)-C(2))-methyltransferase RlmN [Gammaproteobacteria bacterium]|jgi:23S rRNA (adenine2503-C2)-methyltransferase|nr:23S rRNA (adenine(2503)-C(2))-methyltransferase RlmN [Gammaproteobacteria bacterium]MDP6616284.1 23S rRNA (adenine(2503)-C(2))-methyltransferase RlmN [Gammaproteobacteria bacterium]MDP6693998.1 23S rRNA (adenine(2503)-C(2))-methyltransferase RlmN [Gammaproteobacteria bacterium]MDP7042259.1 23S rRNA (adenine(2503)-C(2))-methyltransferase RlmN [Gammaproteobacteria bacterium]
MNAPVDSSPVNLLGMPRTELEAWFTDRGEKTFRARQLMQWVYRRSVLDPGAMTDLSLALRESLDRDVALGLPQVREHRESADGTVKWLLEMGHGQDVEMVFIPEEKRGTLCVSSQVGCAMDCPFCATGRQGFNRNLSAAEIIGQVILAIRELGGTGEDSPVSNVVFMGMGEPLANFKEVVKACDLLTDDLGLGISRRRVTVSTSGLVPQIQRLAELSNVALAISLHAANDKLRDELVPINRRHNIAELLDACWDYADRTNSKQVTFEYIMLDGVNDQPRQARELASLLVGRPAKVNLIPFNPVPGTPYERSPGATVDAFRKVLMDKGVITITRRPRGNDIDAACGQLAGNLDNRISAPLGAKTMHTGHRA